MDQQLLDLWVDIEDYSEWIEKEIPINSGWIDEINYLSFIRDEIHKKIKDMENSGVDSTLHILDKVWQGQIASSIDKEFKYTDKPLGNYPGSLWWWHIDRLTELTEVERSTI